MAYNGLKKAVTLAPTVRSLPSGVPAAPLLNLAARAPASAHDDHGHAVGPRTDTPPRWVGGLTQSSSGLVSKSYITLSPTTRSSTRFIHTTPAVKDAPEVPDFGHYRANDNDSNRALSYFMVGTLGLVSASVAKSSVTEFLKTMSASADVLALAKVEIDLNTIPEGKNVVIKWRGKPVFIRHRTQGEIDEAREVKWQSLRDPESDDMRVKKPEFCPCHGSHYDISGRARKGPAPLNLEIPAYEFNEAEGKVIIG
ncbi:Rieske [2Fe-2S] iron-sulfur domain-containing protein [Mycena amicta]|nr:Rieske [2Fe-2S] iron-sulfur domain-containing protein [Mycena amicta]